jgi:hypothetical protein
MFYYWALNMYEAKIVRCDPYICRVFGSKICIAVGFEVTGNWFSLRCLSLIQTHHPPSYRKFCSVIHQNLIHVIRFAIVGWWWWPLVVLIRLCVDSEEYPYIGTIGKCSFDSGSNESQGHQLRIAIGTQTTGANSTLSRTGALETWHRREGRDKVDAISAASRQGGWNRSGGASIASKAESRCSK